MSTIALSINSHELTNETKFSNCVGLMISAALFFPDHLDVTIAVVGQRGVGRIFS